MSCAVPDVFDATAREAQRNCWHLDDHPAVHVEVDDDGQPHFDVDNQLHMVKQGVLLSRIVLGLAADLPGAPAICCITSTNESNGTFRFHQVRPGDTWLDDDLDRYRTEMIVVVEGLIPAR